MRSSLVEPLHIQAMISDTGHLTAMCSEVLLPKPRKVICGEKHVSWNEREIPFGSLTQQFFLSKKILYLLQKYTQSNCRIASSWSWSSEYRSSEYINLHRDKSGDAQVILCLKAPCQQNGGLFCYFDSGSEKKLHMQAGDILIFKANEVFHRTTPLRPTRVVRNPVRVVAVCRYWFTR